MELPIGHWIDLLQAGIGRVPPTLLAIILLGGPTACWALYHFVVQPRTARLRAFEHAPFWVCPNCRSVNDHRLARCYHCNSEPLEEDIEVIDTSPSGPRPLTPVGPGLDLGRPGPLTRPLSIAERAMPSAEMGAPILVGEPPEEEWDVEFEEDDRVTLPDIAAMTEVIEAPGRRRTARPPTSIPVGPGNPAAARPRRVAVAGQTRDGGDDPPAA